MTARTNIVVVYGLPASGKTTYVRSQMKRGDLIVDVDFIFAALSGLPMRDKPIGLLPFVAAARDAVCERLRRESEVPAAWIITTDESFAITIANRLKARLIEMRIDENERQRRLNQRVAEDVPAVSA